MTRSTAWLLADVAVGAAVVVVGREPAGSASVGWRVISASCGEPRTTLQSSCIQSCSIDSLRQKVNNSSRLAASLRTAFDSHNHIARGVVVAAEASVLATSLCGVVIVAAVLKLMSSIHTACLPGDVKSSVRPPRY